VIAGLVLAAGEGRRFGGPKQLAELRGRPLLEHAVRAMAAAPGIDRVLVVLGARAEEIRARVDLGGAEVVVCAAWAEGMSASLRCGLDALSGADPEAVVIMLGDQPLITAEVVAAVVGAAGDAPAARAVYDGVPGHPVLLARELFPRLRELRGDQGARELLGSVEVARVEVGHLCRPDDVDTPEQLDALAP
jgi:molybdenum cofactor cytidylyltransferase